jgi:hypothetical protein
MQGLVKLMVSSLSGNQHHCQSAGHEEALGLSFAFSDTTAQLIKCDWTKDA